MSLRNGPLVLRSSVLSPWLAGALLFAVVSTHAFDLLPERITFGLSAMMLFLFAWQAAPWLATGRERIACIGSFLGAVLLQALPEILRPSASSAYEFAWRTNLVMSGWSFVLSLIPLQTNATPSVPSRNHNWFSPALLISATFAALAGVHFAVRGRFAIVIDEVLYLLQSTLLREPGYTRAIDPPLAPFFLTRQSYLLQGRLNGQYPPGWPLFLCFFKQLGLRWLAPVCAGVLAVALVYFLGKRLRSHRVGFLAAALLATSYWFIFSASTYYSHTLSMACGLAAACLLLLSETKDVRLGLLWWTAAGLALGAAVITRPLTGVGLGLSLWAWIVLRRKIRGPRIFAMCLAMSLGAAVPLVFLFHYNRIATGHPFLFGYQVANGTLHNMGFGQRGMIVYGPGGNPVALAENFGPKLAIFHFFHMLRSVSVEFIPAFVLAPLMLIAARYKIEFYWAKVSTFLFLPVFHFFYYFAGPRFCIELLPFLLLAVAILVTEIHSRDKRVGQSIGCFLLLGSVLASATHLREDYKVFHNGFRPYFEAIADLHRQKGDLLVFVDDQPTASSAVPPGYQVLFEALSWFSVDTFPGSVIVARDLGPQNSKLTERWPEHYAVRIRNEGIGKKPQRPTLVPLETALRAQR